MNNPVLNPNFFKHQNRIENMMNFQQPKMLPNRAFPNSFSTKKSPNNLINPNLNPNFNGIKGSEYLNNGKMSVVNNFTNIINIQNQKNNRNLNHFKNKNLSGKKKQIHISNNNNSGHSSEEQSNYLPHMPSVNLKSSFFLFKK
jgi:hypothetical protein